MRLTRALAVSVLLAGVASLPALAFQEQQSGSAGAPPAAAEPAAPAQGVKDPVTEFSSPTVGTESEGGTEVNIPGLGKLGVLPKMNFGLELLYGANGQQETMEHDPGPETDDLRIRGSVKHRF